MSRLLLIFSLNFDLSLIHQFKIKIMKTEEFITGMLLDSWNGKIKQANTLFEKLKDGKFAEPVAPGRNTVVFLMGHLIAVHDNMLEALELRKRLYPELDAHYLVEQQTGQRHPEYKELKEQWDMVNDVLDHHFRKMTTADWMAKHHYVSEEDFAKEPKRNKLNILVSRSAHLSHHIGQLVLVK